MANIDIDKDEILKTSKWLRFLFMALYAFAINIIIPIIIKSFFLFGFVQSIDNFLIQPSIYSKAFNAHPLEIFLVIIIGGLLFGIIGMITAVPCYTALKVILKEFLSDNKIVKSLTKDI